MSEENTQDVWQVEANGHVYDATFDDMAEWIAEGSLLRMDRVRRGNLRWIEAGKVPALLTVFNAKDASPERLSVSTTSGKAAPQASSATVVRKPQPLTDVARCCIHPDLEAAFVCDTCFNKFCGACPKTFGGTVRTCPMCGALCEQIEPAATGKSKNKVTKRGSSTSFDISDLVNAFAHPLKFKFSLIVGALMFAIVSIGQLAALTGSIFLVASAFFCFMAANMFTFGVLTNTVDNFAQGKLDEDFMPKFEDFSLYESVLKPFLLFIGVYVSSFGPFLLVSIIAAFFFASSLMPAAEATQAKDAQTIKELIAKQNKDQQARIADMQRISQGGEPDASTANASGQGGDEAVAKLQQMLDEQSKNADQTSGQTSPTLQDQKQAIFQTIVKKGMLLLVIAGICLLWGIFYFPAACTVAGYTGSVGATLNPSVGLDTIRRLGADYLKLLGIGAILLILTAAVTFTLQIVLAPLNLPHFGNVPASFLGNLIGFYIWAVFACSIGYILFKAGDRLKLPR